uniref:Uncharacterized protein n=1 Tax=Arundo donax TaxID=35708 RepID=A0A0A9DGZ5_ARUDO
MLHIQTLYVGNTPTVTELPVCAILQALFALCEESINRNMFSFFRRLEPFLGCGCSRTGSFSQPEYDRRRSYDTTIEPFVSSLIAGLCHCGDISHQFIKFK